MLIWLGKNRLGQKETLESTNQNHDKKLDELIESLKTIVPDAPKPETD
jgi:hypothetical protein